MHIVRAGDINKDLLILQLGIEIILIHALTAEICTAHVQFCSKARTFKGLHGNIFIWVEKVILS